jgi:hypothetical protein
VSERGEPFANCRAGRVYILNFDVTDNSGNGGGWRTGGGCEGSAHVMRRIEFGVAGMGDRETSGGMRVNAGGRQSDYGSIDVK